MKRLVSWCLAASILLGGNAPPPLPLTPREGFVSVEGGPVWYRIFGPGKGTPLLIVHGGPGGSSCSYEPLAEILGKARPVIVYDQLGSGRSGRPMDASHWNLDRFVRELGQVRKALGLKQVHLMGHSWGGALVAAYVTKAQPTGIQSVVLASALLSTKAWIEDAEILRRQLPEAVQATLRQHEQAGTTRDRAYQEASAVFYSRFVSHKPNIPRPTSCGESPFNEEIYLQMWGPSEFFTTGTLRDFDVTPGLPRLRMPVLFIVGRFDEARPETAARFQALIPGARLEIVEDCGHMAPLEDPVAYAKALDTFFRSIPSRKKVRMKEVVDDH